MFAAPSQNDPLFAQATAIPAGSYRTNTTTSVYRSAPVESAYTVPPPGLPPPVYSSATPDTTTTTNTCTSITALNVIQPSNNIGPVQLPNLGRYIYSFLFQSSLPFISFHLTYSPFFSLHLLGNPKQSCAPTAK